MEPPKSQRSDCQPGGSKRSAQDPSSSVDASSTEGSSPCSKKFKPAAVSACHGSSLERAANYEGAGWVQSKPSTSRAKRKAAGGLLANLEGAKGSFSGAAIDYRLPCSAAEDDDMCQIVGQLSTWNEFLCKAHLELREMPGTRSRLSLSACLRTRQFHATKEELHQAVTLAYWLLRTHRCVAAVVFPESLLDSAHAALLSSALQESSSVKSLTFRSPLLGFPTNLCQVVPSLTQLEAFECVDESNMPQTALKTVLVRLLRTTESLTRLRIPKLRWIKGTEVKQFLDALEANSTLKELSVSSSLINKASSPSRQVFQDYMRTSKTLATLTVMFSGNLSEEGVYSFFTGIGANNTLSKVNLVGFHMNSEAATTIPIVLEQSKSLRSFNVIRAHTAFVCLGLYTALYNCWCELFTPIEALDEVTLPVCALSLKQWPLFFKALAKNRNLRRVTIEVDLCRRSVAFEVYAALKRSGAAEKVLLKYEPPYSPIAFPREGFSELYVRPPGRETNRESLSHMIHQLPLYTNITSVILCMDQPHWDNALFSAFSDYVESTTTLRKLRVVPANKYAVHGPDATTSRLWMLLLRSLGQNRSVTELCAETCIDEGVAKELGDVIKTSPNIRRVHVDDPHDHRAAMAFIRGLSVAIEDNYRLTDVMLEYTEPITEEGWFAIRSVAARNSSLATRAAQYVSGAPFNRSRAQALERVSRSPSLMEEVAELAFVSNSEATSRVRGGLRRFEGLHDFMRLCGVVREKVACHVRQDGRMQLDEINEHCWNRVRDYLLVEDVRESTVLPASESVAATCAESD